MFSNDGMSFRILVIGLTLMVSGAYGRYLCPQNLAPCSCQSKQKGLMVLCENTNKETIERSLKPLKEHPNTIISYLTLRQNNMPHLPNFIFLGLDIRHLLITKTNLILLDPNSLSALADKLGVLDMSTNRLNSIPTKALSQLRSTRTLYLSHNNISSILEAAFDGMRELSSLFLYANIISKIDQNAFKGIEKELVRLNLGGNRLTSIPIKALSRLPNLINLEIQENDISSIKESDFSGLGKLDSLKLAHNKIKELEPYVFRNLPRLSTLDLDYNMINRIDIRAFSGLEEKLEWLKLGNNNARDIPSESLRGMHRLREFNFKANNVSELKEDSFEGFGSTLRFLYMENNRIDQLPMSVFSDMHSLEILALSNNSIKHLPQEAFQPIIETVTVIDIHDNPLNCDCELIWYKQWLLNADVMQNSDKVKPIVLKAKCWSAKDKHEYMIKVAPLDRLYCPHRGTGRGSSATGTCQGILTTFGVLYFGRRQMLL